MLTRLLFSACLLLFFVSFGIGQSETSDNEKLAAERRAKLIDRVTAEATQLRLSENRALVNVRIGVLVFKEDEELGRKLFQAGIGELLAAQQVAESARNPTYPSHDLLYSQNLRPQLLNFIASVDPELALDSLYRTRPSAVERALAGPLPNGKLVNSPANAGYLAQSEISREQRLIRLIADRNPERSAALLKENIRKGLSAETLNSLKRLFEKEPAAANELANEVVSRLSSRGFFDQSQPSYELINLAIALINEHTRERGEQERSLSFDEPRIRTLAEKLISAFLAEGGRFGYVPLDQLDPIAKRYSPGAYEGLKKIAEGSRLRGNIYQSNPELQNLMAEPNLSGEELVAAAKKFPPESQRTIYTTAANRFSSAGQYERAIALLNDNFEGDALENAISSLNWYHAHNLMNKGEYDAAEAMIMEFNEGNRISGLIALANNIFRKAPDENRARAIGILQRVRTLMPDRPENNQQLSQMFSLISAMAAIDTAEAFRNFEPLVDQLNQLTEAWAVVSGFQGGNIREGEYLMSGGFNFGVHIDPTVMSTFAKNDFDRTSVIVDGFVRRELRILLLLTFLSGS